MINYLKEIFSNQEIPLDDNQLAQFQAYFDLLVEWNSKMNLTAITEPREVVVKHFFDSLTPSFFYQLAGQRMIDIGAGAGFPSIPIKICFPQIQLTLLDSLNKRVKFLAAVVEELGLNDVQCLHGRAEELAVRVDHREKYDLAISRAVARLNVLAELSLPFVKLGGKMIALKGTKAEEEVAEAEPAFRILGGGSAKSFQLLLPDNFGERTIILIDKQKSTPKKYPRKAGLPSKEPLQ